MLTVLEVVKKTAEFFTSKGIEPARLNAELIVGHALGLKRMQLYLQFERGLSEPELETIRGLVRRRGKQEPLQYVVGSAEFHGLKLKTDRRALIPRPETEWMVDTVIGRLADRPPERIVDLGTGSGAIALALAAAWPLASVTAVDSSPEALGLAKENAQALSLEARVTFVESNWFSGLPQDARFGLVISNPPYLSAEETSQTAPEVREFEPVQALTSGEQGLADVRSILAQAPDYLEPGGCLAMETGISQHEELKERAQAAGWVRTESLKDLTGRDRCFLAWRP